MNAIDQSLASAVERECSVLQFQQDHGKRAFQGDAAHLKQMENARRCILNIERRRDEELAAIKADRDRLDARERTVIDGSISEIAAEKLTIAKCRAYLAAGE